MESPSPKVVTMPATNVTIDNVVLNGVINPNGVATNAWFEWGIDNAAFTGRSPDLPAGSGTTDNQAVFTATGLQSRTTYYFRIAAINSAGKEAQGEIRSFSTPPLPTVTTKDPTEVTTSSAILNGEVNPNGLQTRVWFEWGTDKNLIAYSTTDNQVIGNGVSTLSLNATISVSAGGAYYYRIAASNPEGASRGDIVEFLAYQLPDAVTAAATSITLNSADLNGNVTPNGLATTAWFEWGTDPSMTTYSSTPTQSAGSGTTSQSTSVPLIGLSTGTTYHFRVAASNVSGTRRGSVLSFTPGAAPTVSTLSATSVGATVATLNGNVTPNGLATTAWFEYGLDSSLSNPSTTDNQLIGSGITALPFSVSVSGLISYETYYFRAVARNAGGTQKGAIKSFPTGEYFVAFGDSITFGTGDDIPGDEIGYEPILQNLLSTARGYPVTIVNAGVPGVDSAYGAANISTTLSVYPVAKYYLVLYGSNDAFIPADPSGLGLFPGDAGYNGSYKHHMQQIISTIVAAGKTPYLAKVPYTTRSTYSIQSIGEYNQVIDELVSSNGISVPPPGFYTYFQGHQGELIDGLHPSGIGYQSMADLWFATLSP